MSVMSRSRRLLWVAGLALLLGSVAGARWVFTFASSAGPAPAPAASAPAAAPTGRVVCIGFVDSPSGVQDLVPLQPGRVVGVLVKEGDEVKKGHVLVQLDTTLAEQRVRQAEADLKAAQDQLRQAQLLPAQRDERVAMQRAAIEAVGQKKVAAQAGLDRLRRLQNTGQTPEEVAAAEAQVKELEAVARGEQARLAELKLADPQISIDRAEAEVKAREAQHKQALELLDECTIKAPDHGRILRLQVGKGDVIGPQSRRPPVQFCDNRPRLVRAEVEQEFAAAVTLGGAAQICDDIRGSTCWRGKVIRVSDWFTHRRHIIQEPLQFNDVRTLECLIEVEDTPGQAPLRIGQRVRVTIPPPAN